MSDPNGRGPFPSPLAPLMEPLSNRLGSPTTAAKSLLIPQGEGNVESRSRDFGNKIIVALDYERADQARAFVDRVRPDLCRLKVGKELFVAAGPAFVEELAARGFAIFLDLKFHDIPNTVAQACKAAARLGVWMMNVHASGGPRMMRAAREALEGLPGLTSRPRLIAVTVLTSMGEDELRAIGVEANAERQVHLLATLAHDSGMDGVVCSAREAPLLRPIGTDFLLVTPGIRPVGSDVGDQTRILTPAQAIQAGSDYLVIGRPITQAADPLAALEAIAREIALASTQDIA
ncbi:MAG: orotidine-5'-phosphate decarboxylase [Gallionellaceae bacterium]|nr:orotidine-5'-phosphate decarboxylase [Gallionellaceae bacterium]